MIEQSISRNQSIHVGDSVDDVLRRAQMFWRDVRSFPPGTQINAEGKFSKGAKIAVISGWLCEWQLLPDGRRQIFGFLLPHEAATVSPAGDGRRELVALTHVEVIESTPSAVELGVLPPTSWTTAEDQRENRMFEQMIRLGRLTAEERMLNLFLDLYHRLDSAGLVQADTLKMPLTQELLADALGLSVVHINRTVQKLKAKGYITLRAGSITLHKPQQLAALACYEGAASLSRPAAYAEQPRAN